MHLMLWGWRTLLVSCKLIYLTQKDAQLTMRCTFPRRPTSSRQAWMHGVTVQICWAVQHACTELGEWEWRMEELGSLARK